MPEVNAGFAAPAGVTVDAFLGGRIEAIQPARGHHRAGLEAILLAAAIDSALAGTVVDLGAGAGVAGMAVAARCRRARVILVERDPALAACAQTALARPSNRRFADRVDVVRAEVDGTNPLGRTTAAAVIANPPFNTADSPSPDRARASAHVLAGDGIDAWIDSAAAILEPYGRFVVIFRADRLTLLTGALGRRFGSTVCLPIAPRAGRAPHRVLVSARRGTDGLLSLPPLVLHGRTGGSFLPPVEAILRDGADLSAACPAWTAAEAGAPAADTMAGGA